jgi:hypothetical protein
VEIRLFQAASLGVPTKKKPAPCRSSRKIAKDALDALKEMGIVEWGRVQFGRLNAGEISMEELLVALPSGCSSTDFAVLGCFCEDHLERSLALYREAETREVRSLGQIMGPTLGMPLVGMLCVGGLRRLVDLDIHFDSGTRFVDEGFAIWLAEWRGRESSFRLACYTALCRIRVSTMVSARIREAIERAR